MEKVFRILQLPRGQRKRATERLVRRILHNESGGEVLEYALVAGLIVAGAVGVIGCVGTKVLARWTSIRSSL